MWVVSEARDTVQGYIDAVLSGEIPACTWVKQAAARHLRDLETGAERGLWFDESAAQLVIDFFGLLKHSKGEWAGQTVKLEPWQQFVLWVLFGWQRDDGTRRFRTAYLEVARKNGKALDVSTPVPTVTGWQEHGSLRPGDRIFAPDGRQVMVEAVTGHYFGPAYNIEFSDGTSIVAHENHEWRTERAAHTKRHRGSRGPLPLVTTAEIAQTLRHGARRDLTHRIPVANSLMLPNKKLPIDPYVLGVWLGDGATDNARISCADDEILEELARRGYRPEKRAGSYCYIIGRGFLQKRLRNLGILGNKRIPRRYLRASHEQRMDLLRGLMDSDGHVTKRGQCEIVQVRQDLFDDIVELIRSVGLKPTTVTDRAQLNGNDCGRRFRVQFCGFRDDPPVLLDRKRARLKRRPGTQTRSMTRQIKAMQPAGQRVVNCIQVEGGEYLAGEGLIATHNSTLAAGVGLYLLVADGEPGAEVYSAATMRDQARITHSEATRMVKASPALRKRITVFKDNLHISNTASKYEPLSSDYNSLQGLNVHGAVVDEVHAHRNRDLWDVLETATGARRQPLMFAITTAGFDRQSLCFQLHEYAEKVLDGVVEDDSFFGLIYTLDEGDEWEDEALWVKSNPASFKKVDDMRRLAERAREMPAALNSFLRLHLDIWTQSETRWLPIGHWQECGQAVDANGLRGRSCYAGLDLSSNTDITALALVFPPETAADLYHVLWRFWLPEDNMHDRVHRDRVPYDAWVRQGYLTTTPGNVIDHAWILAEIDELAQAYDIREVAFDRWGAAQIQTKLMELGGENWLVQFGQGFVSMSPPMKELEKLILGHRLAHGNNPVATWMAHNVMASQDPAGNIKPDKGKSIEKIDGIVALIMALDRATRHEPPKRSIYEQRGLEVA